MVRDYALAASGLLADKLGGPSVRPYQPDGVWEAVAMPGSNTRDYVPDSGDSSTAAASTPSGSGAAPPASMDIFNAPTPRGLHRPPRADQHAAPGARHAQRPAVRRGRPRAWPQLTLKAGRRGPRTTASTSSPAALLARPFRPEERTVVHASLSKLDGLLPGAPRRRQAS